MEGLTNEDVAVIQNALGLAMAWWRKQPRSDFRRKEEAKFADMLKRLDAIAPLPEVGDDEEFDWNRHGAIIALAPPPGTVKGEG